MKQKLVLLALTATLGSGCLELIEAEHQFFDAVDVGRERVRQVNAPADAPVVTKTYRATLRMGNVLLDKPECLGRENPPRGCIVRALPLPETTLLNIGGKKVVTRPRRLQAGEVYYYTLKTRRLRVSRPSFSPRRTSERDNRPLLAQED